MFQIRSQLPTAISHRLIRSQPGWCHGVANAYFGQSVRNAGCVNIRQASSESVWAWINIIATLGAAELDGAHVPVEGTEPAGRPRSAQSIAHGWRMGVLDPPPQRTGGCGGPRPRCSAASPPQRRPKPQPCLSRECGAADLRLRRCRRALRNRKLLLMGRASSLTMGETGK